MKKVTTFQETKMDGKLNVTVNVTRIYGKEIEMSNADGDYIEVASFKDEYYIDVKLEGAINASVTCFRGVSIDREGRSILDLGSLKVGGKMRNVCIMLDCIEQISDACREQLTEEVSPEVMSEIKVVKNAIENGYVLPRKELSKKRAEYKAGMLEGGEGFNPYDYYVSEEYVESIKAQYPKEFN